MEKKRGNGPREINYLWLLVGGYFVYLGYDIIKDTLKGVGGGGIWITLAAIVFFAEGVWLCLRELQAWRRSKREKDQNAIESPDEEEP